MIVEIQPWGIEELTGYKPKFDLWEQFSILELRCLKTGHYENLEHKIRNAFYGVTMVYDLPDITENMPSCVRLTELSMVLNWKIWQYYDLGHMELSKFYDKWWKEVDSWCMEHFQGEDMNYYLRTTD